MAMEYLLASFTNVFNSAILFSVLPPFFFI
jgi:hypothetical protein